MKSLLMLSAVTRVNRHAAMGLIDDIVVSLGGWIEGHTLFSNIAANFRFVLPASALDHFAARLGEAGIGLDAAGLGAIASRLNMAGPDAGAEEVAGALAVTFVHDEPDLRREIPAVPG